MRAKSGWVLFLPPAALFILSTVAAIHESGPFLSRLEQTEVRVAADSAMAGRLANVSVFESRYARTARLDLCLHALRETAEAATGPVSGMATLTRGCLAIAEAIVARSPLDSNGWFVAANLAARVNDSRRATAYLSESYRTGPTEEWIAERRALFAYAIRNRLDDNLRAYADQDVALLFGSRDGMQILAARYAADPHIRNYLIGVAETLDRDKQERFLSRIRTACAVDGCEPASASESNDSSSEGHR